MLKPNLRVAALNNEMLAALMSALRLLPPAFVENMVVTQYMHHPCINNPAAQIACSRASTAQLAMIQRTAKSVGIEFPMQWQYDPPLPQGTPVEVFFYGMCETCAQRIADIVHASNANFFNTVTIVTDMSGEPSGYAEVRSRDMNMSTLNVVTRLLGFIDVEVYTASGGRPDMLLYTKRAT